SIFATLKPPKRLPVAPTKHPHLSVVQFFKEPLPLQRERDSDKPYRFRQAPQQTFLNPPPHYPPLSYPPPPPTNPLQR
ncbi:hypothetical protein LLG90_16260, partial [Aromatoleum toluclasticum]|uniref:hypothetical protein n=1 Tax=Aromatoleum toluclasticum TaxID=92003 RepID=UPI001D18447A